MWSRAARPDSARPPESRIASVDNAADLGVAVADSTGGTPVLTNLYDPRKQPCRRGEDDPGMSKPVLASQTKSRTFLADGCRREGSAFPSILGKVRIQVGPGTIRGGDDRRRSVRPAWLSLSARRPSDRRSGPLEWNWRRSQSTCPARPPDGRHGLTCHRDALWPQRLPTQIQHAQVRLSWTSVHSSTKTPHEQKRDPKQQVNAPPLPWAGKNPNSSRHRLPGLDHSATHDQFTCRSSTSFVR